MIRAVAWFAVGVGLAFLAAVIVLAVYQPTLPPVPPLPDASWTVPAGPPIVVGTIPPNDDITTTQRTTEDHT